MMSSFLAFAWRRQTTNKESSTSNTSCPPSPLPPAVAASQSGETFVTFHDEQHRQQQQDGSHHVLQQSTSSLTPEGLKPRPSIATLRKELGTATPTQQQQPMSPSTPEGLRPRPSIAELRKELGIATPKQQQQPTSNCLSDVVLPLLPPRASSSFSLQGIMASPPISTSSFYSRSRCSDTQEIAESPNLSRGQARTAVGALVAGQLATQAAPIARIRKEQQQQQKPEPATFQAPPLPKRADDDDWQNNAFCEYEDDDYERYYYRLDSVDNDPNQDSRSPMIMRPQRKNNDGAATPKSPSASTTTSNTLAASPSSYAQQASHSSRAHLIRGKTGAQQQGKGYDFAPLVLVEDNNDHAGTEVIWTEQHDQNLSTMSQEQDSYCRSTTTTTTMVHDDDVNYEFVLETCSPPLALDGVLRQRKAKNQRHNHEELFVSILERLQDNVQLVSDVEANKGNAAEFLNDYWLVKTRFDEEGILTGFSEKPRTRIIHNLSLILKEMAKAEPEEFYFHSPSTIAEFAETHDDLRDAIYFCRVLVNLAVPDTEKQDEPGKWLFLPGMRTALGIIPPESPETVRGGDTSVFSLPSDSAKTPMTSNVSTSTTITTSQSPPRNARNNREFNHPGLQVRRTIEIVAVLLQKMTLSCRRLSDMMNSKSSWNMNTEATISITNEIKRAYLQMLAINVSDMKAVVDAFELDLPPLRIIREVSNDDDEEDAAHQAPPPPFLKRQQPPILPPAPPFVTNSSAHQRHSSDSFVYNSHSNMVAPTAPCSRRMNRSSSESALFSPATDDMRTWNPIEEEVEEGEEIDDLRRQVGSNDYDDNDEEREGPPEEEKRDEAIKRLDHDLASCIELKQQQE